MKAISLWQPWATAIALGAKAVETRHWSTYYRGPLAIHAAKRFGAEQHAVLRESDIECNSLPLGAIVATAVLRDIISTEEASKVCTAAELWWGDYSPGRFAWLLIDISPLKAPVPWKGKQGFFNVPDELLS